MSSPAFSKISKLPFFAETWSVGTLKYNFPQLLLVGMLMLLAKQMLAMVCYVLLPQLEPVILDNMHCSKTMIAVVVSTIPSFLNTIFAPIYSTLSDKTRTRYGRRKPYLIWSAPAILLILAAMGFYSEAGSSLARIFPHAEVNWAFYYFAVLAVIYQVVILFPGTVLYYMEADVIPQKCFGQYMAFCSIGSTLCGAAFNYFLLARCIDHIKLAFIGFGAAYLLVYVLQFLFVKEGEYPPVEDKSISKDGSLITKGCEYFVMFFRQCFSRKIFIFLSLSTGLNAASNICRQLYNLLFAMKELHIPKETIGAIGAKSGIISAIMIYFFGKLMDKTHPMLIYFLGGVMIMCVNVFAFFFLKDQTTYFIVTIVTGLVYAFQWLANTPLLVKIFPIDKFGQFSSGNAMINALTLMIGSSVGGLLTEHFGFRFMFVWDFCVTALATAALVGVYFEWLKYGGKNYKPPEVD